MSNVQIVTRGDDAGSCASANTAMLEAVTQGVLRNISVMAPGTHVEQAADLLRNLPGVDFGLHVCLNAEWSQTKWGPVAGAGRVPSLVEPDGNFTQQPLVLHERGYSVDEAMIEIEAQYDRLVDLGFPIAYVDEHMGVGWISGLRVRINEFARAKGLIIAGELPYFPVEAVGVEAFLAALGSLDGGPYVWVNHPGADAADMQAFHHPGLESGQVARERDADRRFWTDSRLRGAFQPLRYSEAVR